ncbi:hypothetical protein BCR34DRAFT_543404 [Clohesyomyces aquaticus]|uniref:Uncharacterized protein n=1 Tax=Clohesyomyces aquaticus TaxID=1231657 RepID=A0A1Y1Z7H4_9PLEO|nr:hypothetical protein BCR34DRAFT_543404 [Clohesyomyces aquaticus]
MPIQRTCFGQPVRLQMPPRRFQLLFATIVLFTVALHLFGPPASEIPYIEKVTDHIPQLPAARGPSAHKPPVQPNSTVSSSYRAIEWFTDFKWRNPFSSSITLDEDRAVLPPLKERPPIYTFYDAPGKQDKAVSEAENRLILAWRRAWWAQGFKPLVLSRKEAMQHPQYQLVQRLTLEPKTQVEIMKWLAWGHMGGGILANWLAFPMAGYGNPMLSFLRRKEYPILSRVDTLQNGVFFGEAAAVNAAIKKALDNPLFKNMTANKDEIAALGKKTGGAMVSLVSPDDIAVDSKADGIAYYSTDTIASQYEELAKKITANTTLVEGLDMLANLVNAHLHLTFQAIFHDGVEILKPLPEHTTALTYEAYDIARNLTQCPSSPLPKSCPPNNAKCSPCNPSKPLKLVLSESHTNSSALYTIGTVPHPYTLNLLHYERDTVDGNFLRRNAARDQWILATTEKLLGDGHSGPECVIHFKEAVAAPLFASNSLWLTAERESQVDLDWIFGFNLPQAASDNKEPTAPDEKSGLVVFPRPEPPSPLPGESQAYKGIGDEEARLKKAREVLKSKDRRMQDVVKMVEQWNLADTEAWKFARAWSARRREERKIWEKQETKYAGAESKAGVRPGGAGGDGRWID